MLRAEAALRMILRAAARQSSKRLEPLERPLHAGMAVSTDEPHMQSLSKRARSFGLIFGGGETCCGDVNTSHRKAGRSAASHYTSYTRTVVIQRRARAEVLGEATVLASFVGALDGKRIALDECA